MAKCPKCENDSFVGEKTESPYRMVLVKCKDCNTAIGLMEDIDVIKWKNDMYKNHNFFEGQFNILKNEINELKSDLKEKNMLIIDLLENLNNKLK